MNWVRRRLLSPHYRADSTPTKMGEGKFIFYPRALDITWGGDPRYWKVPDLKGQKEGSFAELKQVSWLEVTGSTNENVKIGETYKVGFIVSLRADAFGWDECNVYIMAKIGKRGKFYFKKVSLNHKPIGEMFKIPMDEEALKIKVEKPNYENDPNADLKLYFGMYEVWTKRWKGGLNIHYAFVEQLL